MKRDKYSLIFLYSFSFQVGNSPLIKGVKGGCSIFSIHPSIAINTLLMSLFTSLSLNLRSVKPIDSNALCLSISYRNLPSWLSPSISITTPSVPLNKGGISADFFSHYPLEMRKNQLLKSLVINNILIHYTTIGIMLQKLIASVAPLLAMTLHVFNSILIQYRQFCSFRRINLVFSIHLYCIKIGPAYNSYFTCVCGYNAGL